MFLESVKRLIVSSYVGNLRHRSGVSSSVRTLLDLHATLILLLLPGESDGDDDNGDFGGDHDDDYDRVIILDATLLLLLLALRMTVGVMMIYIL